MSNFLAANNIGGAVYFWDDNGSETGRGTNSDYIVVNGTIATNTTPAGGQTRYNQHIGSAQGFFVKLQDNTNTTITFTETMRVSGSNEDDHFFRKTEDEISYVRINLTDSHGLFKQSILCWVDGISDTEVDRSFDARVFNAKSDYAIYTIKANTPLAIQGITYLKEEVPLGLNVAESGSYTIAIDLENYIGQTVYLKDNVTGETVDLTSEAYTFSSAAGQITDRFVLTTTSGILALDDQKVNVYAVDKVLHIKTAGFQPAEYLMYNLSGKRIMQVLISGTTKIDLNHVPNGVYLISDGIETKKIILK
ncbi:MAG: hypothetical protein ACJA08_001483 [Cyclobacteriaceae bacterium]